MARLPEPRQRRSISLLLPEDDLVRVDVDMDVDKDEIDFLGIFIPLINII
jgi:hypothetical protein